MKLNKTDLCGIVAELTGIPQDQIRLTINTTLKCIERILELEGRVSIRDFGTFSLKMVPRRVWNPLLNEYLEIPERMGIRFEAGKGFKKKVSRLR